MGNPRDLIKNFDPTPAVAKEQSELLNALTTLAETKKDAFKDLIAKNLRTANTDENQTVAIIAVEDMQDEIHAYTSTAPANTIEDAVNASTGKFLAGGAQNIVNGVTGLVSAFATSFLGKGSAGSASDSMYTVARHGLGLWRVDVCAWSYTLQTSGLLANMQSINVFVYSKSTVDIQKLVFQTFLNKYQEALVAAKPEPTVDDMMKELEDVKKLYNALKNAGVNKLLKPL